jgi:hypothetical protein
LEAAAQLLKWAAVSLSAEQSELAVRLAAAAHPGLVKTEAAAVALREERCSPSRPVARRPR